MKTLDKKGRKLVTTWSTLLLGTFLSAGAEASEPSCCQERLSINQQQIHNSNHASHIQQPILLAFEGGRSRPSGVLVLMALVGNDPKAWVVPDQRELEAHVPRGLEEVVLKV